MAENQKIVKLTDLLTEAQLDEVERILNGCNGDREVATKQLRTYFGTIRAELEEKGANPDFLAYVIACRQWTGGDNGDRAVNLSQN